MTFMIGFICGIIAVPVIAAIWALSRYAMPHEDTLPLSQERRWMMTKDKEF